MHNKPTWNGTDVAQLQARPLRSFLCMFVTGRARDCVVSCAVACFLAVTSGASILLLLPMLQLCGISSVDEVASPVENGVRHAFRVFGVSPTFSSVLLVFVLLSAIQAVLLYVQAIIDGKLKHGFSRTLRVELYSAMNLATWESQAGTRTADVAHALSVEVDRIQGGVASLLALASGIVLVSAFAVVSMAVAPGMSLLAIIGCTLFWPLLLYPNRLAKRSGSRLTQRARGFYRQVLDQLGGLKESKLLSAEERHILLFHKLAGDIRTAGMEFERAKGATNFVFSFCAGVSLCIMLYVGTEYLRTPAVDLLVLVVVFLQPYKSQFRKNTIPGVVIINDQYLKTMSIT